MKKFLLSILVIASCSFAASAQTSANDQLVGISVGFAGLEDTTFGVNYEYIIADRLFGGNFSIGLGANLLYYGYSEETNVAGVKYTYDHDNFIGSIRAALHFTPIKNLDFFAAGNIGGASLTEKETLVGGNLAVKSVSETEPKFVYGGVVGARYYFFEGLGLGVEGSIGNALSRVSISLLVAF